MNLTGVVDASVEFGSRIVVDADDQRAAHRSGLQAVDERREPVPGPNHAAGLAHFGGLRFLVLVDVETEQRLVLLDGALDLPELAIGLERVLAQEGDDTVASLDPSTSPRLPRAVVRLLHRHIDVLEWG